MTTAELSLPARPRRSTLRRALALARRHLLTVYGVLALGYLVLPVFVVIAFSFNDPAGKFNYTWKGFTLDNWRSPFGVAGIRDAVVTSLEIAAIVTVVATVLGTLIAMALVRYGFRGRGLVNFLVFVPLSTPEIVLGASLLTLFLNLGVQLGFWTIVIAHITFNISFVVVTVRARLVGFNVSLEEAGMDLYADGRTTFWKVTFPIIFPGILSAALLAFALSIDDYVITLFSAGRTVTFPLWVFGVSRLGIPPEVNVLGTLIFLVAVLFIVTQLWSQRRAANAPSNP